MWLAPCATGVTVPCAYAWADGALGSDKLHRVGHEDEVDAANGMGLDGYIQLSALDDAPADLVRLALPYWKLDAVDEYDVPKWSLSASQLATRVVKATSTPSANPALNKLFEPPTSNPLNLPLFEPVSTQCFLLSFILT